MWVCVRASEYLRKAGRVIVRTSGEVAALYHKAGDDAMEAGSFESDAEAVDKTLATLTELLEIQCCFLCQNERTS